MNIDYRLIRSGRRTLALEITADARLLVRAPRNCPEAYIARFVESRTDWIESRMERQRRQLTQSRTLSEAEIRTLTAEAESVIPPLVRTWSEKLGLVPAGLRITGAKQRFGSCSAKNSLCFSYRLLLYPREAVEYVVVHELAHIAHKNHGRDFYALIAAVLPDYRAREKLLKIQPPPEQAEALREKADADRAEQ
jgi:predicted metal-dependent hydrolase